jgi:hypothetical protein
MLLQQPQCCRLGTKRGLADIAHVVDMKVDEVTEGFEARNS